MSGISLQPFLLDGITLTDERNIGDGAYATVVPLSFRGLKCAGKKLHTIFFQNASPEDKKRMLDRFQEECQLLSQLKHPNTVQFLGIHFEDGSDPGSDLPILVMEILHCTLSESVDRYGALLEQVGMGILDDVAMGLCYLHGHRPPIVHRDLSANNVLLSSDMKAKISDLGVAKILDLTPSRMSQLTKCPGTLSYMPPEALREKPLYDTKLDCFSFGVMILHVLCGRWPHPSEPTRIHPKKRNKVIGLTEVERRKEYFQQVGGGHPLVELIRGCLDNDPSRRPAAIKILHKLRQVISRSPPSCGDKLELLNQTQTLKIERQGLSEQLEQLQGECEQVSNEVAGLRALVKTKDEERRGFSEQLEQLQAECKQLREVSNEVDGLKALVKTKDEEKRSLSEQLEHLQRELTQSHGRQERLELSHSIDMEQVQCRVSELCTEVEGLRVVVGSKENVIQTKEKAIEAKAEALKAKETEKQQAIQAKEQAIHEKEIEKQQAIQAKEQIIQIKEIEKHQAIKAMEIEKQEAIKVKEIEKQQAVKAKEQAIRAKEQAIHENKLDVATKEKVIESQQQVIASKNALLAERDATIGKTTDQVKTLQGYLSANQSLHLLHPQINLHWRRCADMPKTLELPQSIVIGDAVFVAACNSRSVLRYETRRDQWSVLPSCPVKWFGLGQLSGKLVTVGGEDGRGATSHVYTYEQETQQWVKSIPPLPTPCYLPAVITYNSGIAVCGHEGDTVVFNSETAQWNTAAPLPVACGYMQITIINDVCYLGGGGFYKPNSSIMCASLPSLFQSSSPHEQQTSAQHQHTMLPDMPLYRSALANIGGSLLALGGHGSTPSSLSDAIHAYSASTKTWVNIASLPQPCYGVTAELLPSGQVVLIGGKDDKENSLKAVYIGTLS